MFGDSLSFDSTLAAGVCASFARARARHVENPAATLAASAIPTATCASIVSPRNLRCSLSNVPSRLGSAPTPGALFPVRVVAACSIGTPTPPVVVVARSCCSISPFVAARCVANSASIVRASSFAPSPSPLDASHDSSAAPISAAVA